MQASAYLSEARSCNLCLEEKFAILKADLRTNINKRSEMFLTNAGTEANSNSVALHNLYSYLLILTHTLPCTFHCSFLVFVYIFSHCCITVLPDDPVLPLHVVGDARLPVCGAASLLVASEQLVVDSTRQSRIAT